MSFDFIALYADYPELSDDHAMHLLTEWAHQLVREQPSLISLHDIALMQIVTYDFIHLHMSLGKSHSTKKGSCCNEK